MPYPRAHSRLTILGDMYSGTEEWQTNLRLDGTTVPTQAQLGTVDTAVQTFLSTTNGRLPNGFRYVGLKWAPQNTEGRYGDDGEAVEFLAATPLSGGTVTSYPQIAIVISLRTNRARGYASNGRMYFPTFQTPATDSGKITPGTAAALASSAATMIQSINQVGLGNACVASAVGAGRIERVSGVRVGRVVDTQRRRRNQIPEEYSTVSAVPS